MTWRPAPEFGEDRPHPLREAIEAFLRRGGHGGVSTLSRVAEIWEATVGAQVASHVRPSAIVDDTLFVDVDQAAWSTEMTFLATRVLATLEERLDTHVATYLKARVRGGSGVE